MTRKFAFIRKYVRIHPAFGEGEFLFFTFSGWKSVPFSARARERTCSKTLKGKR